MNYQMISYLENFKARYLAWCFILFCSLGILHPNTHAQSIPPRPSPPRLVNDFANVLSAQEREALERKMVRFSDSTSTQVAIITIKTLNGYTIEETAHKFLREWGVGQKEKNNGVVILAAIEDRKINIQTGLGMEGVLPDLVCKRIINKDIIPAFKRQQYYEGFDDATTSIIQISKNEYTADKSNSESDGIGLVIFIFIVVILFFIIIAIARRNRGTVMTRRGYTDWDGGGWWYLPGGGHSNWGNDDNHRGGGGWDFGGFGGGDGGGGGASGDW
jgi:uncharacterized protein